MKQDKRIMALFGLLLLSTVGHAGSDLSREVYVAVRAYAGEQHALQKWGPTLAYLNQALPDHHFSMIPYTDIKQELADARANRFHFLLTNPATYVELEVSTGARAMLTLINNRRGTPQTRFGSVIFTHVDNTDIIQLRDLRDKHFMAVTPMGFGGWRVGLKVLLEQGIEPDKDFASLSFAGNQTRVVDAVLAKKVHAGMVRTDMLERLADTGKLDLRKLRILNQRHTENFPFFHSSPLYPEWPFTAMANTDRQLAAAVKLALLQLDKQHPAARAGRYMGWTEAQDYQAVKILMAELGIEPFAKNRTGQKFLLYVMLPLVSLLVAFYFFRRYSYETTD